VGETKDAAALFPKEGLVRETVRLCATDTFCLEGLNNVLTGEYSLKDGKATAFMAQRDTPEQAEAEARRYLDFLAANGYQKVQAPGPTGDIPVFVLDNSFEMVFAEGRTWPGCMTPPRLPPLGNSPPKLRTALKGGREATHGCKKDTNRQVEPPGFPHAAGVASALALEPAAWAWPV